MQQKYYSSINRSMHHLLTVLSGGFTGQQLNQPSIINDIVPVHRLVVTHGGGGVLEVNVSPCHFCQFWQHYGSNTGLQQYESKATPISCRYEVISTDDAEVRDDNAPHSRYILKPKHTRDFLHMVEEVERVFCEIGVVSISKHANLNAPSDVCTATELIVEVG